MYQPAYQPPRKPLSDYLKVLLSDVILAALLFIGMLLLWLGSVWAGASDSLDKDGALGVKSFGMLLVTWALIIGGVLRHDIEKWARVAMIAAGTLLIIAIGYWSGPLFDFSGFM